MLSRRAWFLGGACAVFLAAAVLGLALFGLGLADQWWRLALAWRRGFGFADPACTTGYCDYAMLWLAGFLVRHGQDFTIYDPHGFGLAGARILPYAHGFWPFVYPPLILPLAAVVSAVPLVPGYYVFVVCTAVAGAWLFRRAGMPWWCIALGGIGPAAMWNFYLGQLGWLCGGILVAGLAWLPRRPLLAGAALACLAIKPQYALLVPVILLAGRHVWTALAAVLSGLGALAAAFAVGGTDVFKAYFGPGRAATGALLDQPFGGYQVMGSSVLWMLRSGGAGLQAAYTGQALVSLAAAVVAWRLWSREAADPLARIMATVFLTTLASPYGFTDDLAAQAVMLAAMLSWETPWRNAALAWLWVAPAFVPKFVALFGVLPTPLLGLVSGSLLKKPSAGGGTKKSR